MGLQDGDLACLASFLGLIDGIERETWMDGSEPPE
jgi:hypothetical protein